MPNVFTRIGQYAGDIVKGFRTSVPQQPPNMKDRPAFLGAVAESQRWNGGDLSNIDEAQIRAVSNSWVFTAINEICWEIIGGEIQVVQPIPRGDPVQVYQHPFLHLMETPNKHLTADFIWYFTTFWLELNGNAYWFLGLDNQGKIQEIWPIPATSMNVIPGESKFIEGYQLNISGHRYNIPAEYIVHFKLPNPFSIYTGMSRLIAAMLPSDSDTAMSRWNGGFFGSNNVMPNAIINLSSGDPNIDLDPDDVESLKRDLTTSYSASERKTAITSAYSMNVQLLGWNPRDMDFLQGRQFSKEEILTIWGIPPGLLDKNVNRSTADAAREQFRNNVIWPLMKLIIGQANLQMFNGEYYSKAYRSQFKDIRTTNREQDMLEFDRAKEVMTEDELRARFFHLGPKPKEKEAPKPTLPITPVPILPTPGQGQPIPGNDQVAPQTAKPGTPAPTAAKPAAPAAKLAPQIPQGMSLDLLRWQAKAIKGVRGGKSLKGMKFTPDELPEDITILIKNSLSVAQTPEAVEAVFSLAQKAVTKITTRKQKLPIVEVVEVTPEDVNAVITRFNRLVPEKYAGMLE